MKAQSVCQLVLPSVYTDFHFQEEVVYKDVYHVLR